MDGAATISLRELVLEFGNRFFDIEDSEWMNYQDDLHYEETETEGINGYVLKMEEKADGYGNRLFVFLINIFWGLKRLFFKERNPIVANNSSRTVVNRRNVQSQINYKVQNRLLSVINEDIEKWNIESGRSIKYHQTRVYPNRNSSAINGKSNRKSKSNILYSLPRIFSTKQANPQRIVKNPMRE